MKPDSMLVEPEHIGTARDEVLRAGPSDWLAEFAKQEPALASYVSEGVLIIAGKLAVAGAPTPLVQGVHEDVLALLLTAVQAQRHGHYALWKDAAGVDDEPAAEPPADGSEEPEFKDLFPAPPGADMVDQDGQE